MEYKKLRSLFSEYGNIETTFGEDNALTLEEAFVNLCEEAEIDTMEEFEAWIEGAIQKNKELTDDKDIVLAALVDFLKDCYYDEYDEGTEVVIKLGDEILYRDVVA